MKILICPLNWGLGHATRCVPIISRYLADGHEVQIAADGYPLEFLKQAFPALKTIELPSYQVKYSKLKTQIFAMLQNIPYIMYGVANEYKKLHQILTNEHFDLVISDNRFGLHVKKNHSNVRTIYITHQIMVKMPKGLKIFEPLVAKIHKNYIEKFDECWIPDIAENGGYAGDLSHKYKLPHNAKYIGLLSRFSNITVDKIESPFKIVAVLSGLEPHRTMLEHKLIEKFRKSPHPALIVYGQPRPERREYTIGNVTLMSHLPHGTLAAYLQSAEHIICRSGYSTIMDLIELNCIHKAEFIPTPGQTEQEYLCDYWLKKRVVEK